VDNNVRRKMEEMLKTWKEPVPGSIDTRPVFLPEVTRPIENALIKARTSAIQAHQEYARTQQQPLNRGRAGLSSTPYRDTPTPPNAQKPAQYPPQTYGQQPNPNINQYTGPQYHQQSYGSHLVRWSFLLLKVYVLTQSSHSQPHDTKLHQLQRRLGSHRFHNLRDIGCLMIA